MDISYVYRHNATCIMSLNIQNSKVAPLFTASLISLCTYLKVRSINDVLYSVNKIYKDDNQWVHCSHCKCMCCGRFASAVCGEKQKLSRSGPDLFPVGTNLQVGRVFINPSFWGVSSFNFLRRDSFWCLSF